MKLNIMSCILFCASSSSLAANTLNEQTRSYENNNRGLTVRTVGDDGACMHRLGSTRIQDAIDSGALEIRIANNLNGLGYKENIIINDRSLTIKGGYNNCDDADNDIQGTINTDMTGVDDSGTPVIDIRGDTERHNIVLDRLDISNGSGEGFLPGGGISTFFADTEIHISNSTISFNTSAYGGGIAILDGNTDVFLSDSFITNNSAGYGGGVHCSGGGSSVEITGNSGVSINSATNDSGTGSNGRGGGLHLTNGCRLVMYSGTSNSNISDLRGIAFNTAVAEGGGIYAEDGSLIILQGQQTCPGGVCIGDNENPVNLTYNYSNWDLSGNEGGGGAYLTNLAEMNVVAGIISHNSANSDTIGGHGGGIYVDNATFSIGKFVSECWDSVRCNQMSHNSTGTFQGYGGAIYNNAGVVQINRTFIDNNLADLGTAIYSTGVPATNDIAGAVFHDNGNGGANDYTDANVIRLISEAQANIRYSTFADNNVTGNVFGVSSSTHRITVLSSIIDDSVDVMSTTSATTEFDCIMAHEASSFSGTRTVIDDPDFVDRDNQDYHLKTDSPAVDFCDDSVAIAIYTDMDEQTRGENAAWKSDVFGAYDLGADEVSDIIFRNDFGPTF